MKKLIFFLLLMSLASYSQKLKDRIQGDWLCVSILDSHGHPIAGKYGNADDFLKFKFKNSTFTACKTPFDTGVEQDIVFKNGNSFDWLPTARYELPERVYVVKNINDKYMILATRAQNGDSITYYFMNQKNFPCSDAKILDNGILVVKHLLTSKDKNSGANKAYEYQINNDSTNLYPRPTFKYSTGGDFGGIFSYNFKLPEDFELDQVSDELIIDFDVAENGAKNFNIIKGLNDKFNSETIRVMTKLRKYWKPLVVDKKIINTTMRMHIHFYQTIVELQPPWKH
ncbi:MAG TPA: hypothetical protein VI413_09895 [Paludibacter sp.]